MSSLYMYFAPLTLDNDNEIISDFHGHIEHPFLQAVKTQFDEGFPLYKPRYDETVGMVGAFGLMPNAFSCGMTTKIESVLMLMELYTNVIGSREENSMLAERFLMA